MRDDSLPPLGELWGTRSPSSRPARRQALRSSTAHRIRAAMVGEERRRLHRGWLLGSLVAGLVAAGTTVAVRGLPWRPERATANEVAAPSLAATPGLAVAPPARPRPIPARAGDRCRPESAGPDAGCLPGPGSGHHQ